MKKRSVLICIAAAGGIASGCFSFHEILHAGMVPAGTVRICMLVSVLLEILVYILAEGVCEAYMRSMCLSMAASILMRWAGTAGFAASGAVVLLLPYVLMAGFHIYQRTMRKTCEEEKNGRIYLS